MPKFTPIHYATIQQGVMQWKDRDRLGKWLSSLKGDVEVIIRKKMSRRSTKQNNYYWAYLAIIEKETGDIADDLHEFFKRKLLAPEFKTILGYEIRLPRSTTKLDKLEFTEYITKIEALSGIPAPNPEDYYLA